MGRLDGKVALITGAAAASAGRPRCCSPARGLGGGGRPRRGAAARPWRSSATRSGRAPGPATRWWPTWPWPPTAWRWWRPPRRPTVLDVLFNNAGVMLSSDDDALATDEGTWDTTMDVNAKGVFLGCKYGIPALRRSGGGAIVNTASFVAKMGAATSQVAYTASKGAVLAFSRELAVIHARDGIRVNALCPGPLRTELLMKFLDTDEKRQRRLVHIPMGRFGEAAEIARRRCSWPPTTPRS